MSSSSSSQDEIVKLESEINSIKEDIEELKNDWERNKTELLQQMRGSTSTSIQTTLDFVAQIHQLALQYNRKKTELDLKLLETRTMYFTKLQQ
jgi:peptidoglycan hydrolase CwlO-like protein